jgi:peptidoglycan lytic transglycosylase
LTRQRRSGFVAALACASLLAVTHCVAAKSAATLGGTNSSSGATAKVAAKAAKPGSNEAASAKSKEKKSLSGKTTPAAVPLPRARPGSSGASAPAKPAASGPRGAGTDLPEPPAVPLAQAPPQTSDAEIALVKSAIDSLRSGDADKATRVQATISDPVARKFMEWVILRSDGNGAGSARYAAFVSANPRWPSLAMFRRRAEAMLWVENPKPAQVLSFFNGSPPQSVMGRLVLTRALLAQGDTEGARAQVREAWRNDPMSADVEKQVLERCSGFLSRADHKARMEKRLFAADNETAMRAARRLGGADGAIAKARIALNGKGSNAKKLLEAVPAESRKDPGYTFAHAHILRHEGKIAEAAQVMLSLVHTRKQLADRA